MSNCPICNKPKSSTFTDLFIPRITHYLCSKKLIQSITKEVIPLDQVELHLYYFGFYLKFSDVIYLNFFGYLLQKILKQDIICILFWITEKELINLTDTLVYVVSMCPKRLYLVHHQAL